MNCEVSFLPDKRNEETKTESPEAFSWLSEGRRRISEDTLLKIYEVHSANRRSQLDSHYKYRHYYTTFMSALVAIFLGGMLEFHQEPFSGLLFCRFSLRSHPLRVWNKNCRSILQRLLGELDSLSKN